MYLKVGKIHKKLKLGRGREDLEVLQNKIIFGFKRAYIWLWGVGKSLWRWRHLRRIVQVWYDLYKGRHEVRIWANKETAQGPRERIHGHVF